ncbi:MAG: 5'-nucleotidase C-terminal domain-containing protein [Pseudomonadota bacterium]
MCATSTSARLTLLATSDVHMHLSGFDYRRDAPRPDIGLARLATHVAQVQAEGPCVLLDNGDLLQGTVLGGLAAERDNPVPEMIAAMGYDALGLGNHDVDFGIDAWARFARAVQIPIVCSNFELPGTHPHTIITREIANRGPLHLGVVAALPPQTIQWNAQHLGHLPAPRDPATSVAAAVRAVRAGGADLVVVLGHTGLAADGPDTAENFGTALAQIPGVDALILGHTHRRLPGPDYGAIDGVDPEAGTVFGVPAVMPGFAGSHLGRIDLELEGRPGTWQIVAARTALCPARTAEEDDLAISQIIAPLHARARTHQAEIIGSTEVPLRSHFALLGHDPGQALCAKAMQTAIGPALRDAGLEALPLIAAVAPNAAGGRAGPGNYLNVATGPLHRRDLSAIAPYPNGIWALRATGAELRAWLELSAAVFGKSDPTVSAPALIDPAVPLFNFDSLFGLNAVLDPSEPPGNRVAHLEWGGAHVAADMPFALVTTSYRAAGGGGFPATGLHRVAARAEMTLAQALEALLANGPIRALDPAPFQVDAGGQKRVTLDTGPGALDHLDDIARYDPRVLEQLTSGFVRLGLTL